MRFSTAIRCFWRERGLGATRPGQWPPDHPASWRRLGDLSLGASNVKSTGAVSAGALLFLKDLGAVQPQGSYAPLVLGH